MTGRTMMKCKCAECGITKAKFVKNTAGSGFDELIVKGLASGTKGLVNLGRKGAAKAIKSDLVKQRIKDTANKYLDQALDSFTSDLSKK